MEWLHSCKNLAEDKQIEDIRFYLQQKGLLKNRHREMAVADLKMYYIINKHCFILKFVDNVKDLYSVTLGAQFFLVILCLVIILCQSKTAKLFLILSEATNSFGDIFFYCHFGQKLADTAENPVIENWQLLAKTSRKAVIMYVNAMSKTLTIKAGGYFTLSHYSLMTIIQKSFAVYSVFSVFID